MTPPWDDDALAAARMRSLTRVVRALGHDARGALGAVTLHGTLLVKALEADVAPAAERTRRWAAGLQEGCARLERLLDAVLVHLTAPRGADAALAPVIAGLVELVRPCAYSRRVGIALHAGVLQGPPVPEVARQVLLDALLAAIDGTPDGGEVAVTTAMHGAIATIGIVGPTAALDLAETLAPFAQALAAAGASLPPAGESGFAFAIDIETPEAEETGS